MLSFWKNDIHVSYDLSQFTAYLENVNICRLITIQILNTDSVNGPILMLFVYKMYKMCGFSEGFSHQCD